MSLTSFPEIVIGFIGRHFKEVFFLLISVLFVNHLYDSVKRWKTQKARIIWSWVMLTIIVSLLFYAGFWQSFPPEPPKPPAALPELMTCQTVTVYNWGNKPPHKIVNNCSLIIVLSEPRPQ